MSSAEMSPADTLNWKKLALHLPAWRTRALAWRVVAPKAIGRVGDAAVQDQPTLQAHRGTTSCLSCPWWTGLAGMGGDRPGMPTGAGQAIGFPRRFSSVYLNLSYT